MHARSSLAFALAALLLAVLVPTAQAQQQRPGTDQRSALPGNLPEFAPVEFSVPNQYRDASGRPGPAYWQNEADYAIDVTLRPDAERLDGTVTIDYTNNAPTALDYLWVQLDQNLFKEGSRGSALTSEEDRFSGAFGEGGYDITDVSLQHDGQTYEPEYLIDDTRMPVEVRVRLADGSTETRRLPVEAFFDADTYTAVFRGAARSVRLDPRGYLPDVDPGDNLWTTGEGIHAPSSAQTGGR